MADGFSAGLQTRAAFYRHSGNLSPAAGRQSTEMYAWSSATLDAAYRHPSRKEAELAPDNLHTNEINPRNHPASRIFRLNQFPGNSR